MNALRFSVALSLFLGLSAASARAQDNRPAELPPCVSDWACGSTRPPLGFYVDTVTDDGRYVTLEDGTVWEVQLDYRAAVAGWQRDNFVDVRRIAAPTGDYEWLLTKTDDREWRAAVRLAGRVRRP
jgi:hypothetical protein